MLFMREFLWNRGRYGRKSCQGQGIGIASISPKIVGRRPVINLLYMVTWKIDSIIVVDFHVSEYILDPKIHSHTFSCPSPAASLSNFSHVLYEFS